MLNALVYNPPVYMGSLWAILNARVVYDPLQTDKQTKAKTRQGVLYDFNSSTRS